MRSSGHFIARAPFLGDFSNSVSVLLGKGDGTFQAARYDGIAALSKAARDSQ